MSHLADELARQMSAKGVTQTELSDRSGLAQGLLSKWLSSYQRVISEEQLSALAPALSDAAEDHAALVRAHLLDEKFGPGADLVRIEIDGRTLQDAPRARSKGEKAMEFLCRERLVNRDLNDLLLDLARCLGAEL